ncbi:MAG: DNA-3-methyladenine glycosylase [Mycobacteriales bacterium]
MTTTLRIRASGPFSLAASRRFLEGFAPATSVGAADRDSPLALAFPVEGSWGTVGCSVVQEGDELVASVVGEQPAGDVPVDAVRAQLARIFSLDVDGSGFAALGTRDPVLSRLQERYEGLRPVCFWSAYEAAVWAVIGHRIRMTQAAGIKARLSAELGTRVDVGGQPVDAFPAPAVLCELESFAGLSGRKPEYLRALAQAALDGRLDSARLRSMPRGQAVAQLCELPGIGPFSAELVLLRGAGDPDHFSLHEPRLGRAVGLAYAVQPTVERLSDISAGWAPYRTWASVLLRVWWEEAGPSAPTLAM